MSDDAEKRIIKDGTTRDFETLLQKISTHSPFRVILKVDPQPPRCSWQE
jgi:hypothetical protein